MELRRVTVSLWLDGDQQALVQRRIDHMNSYLAQYAADGVWNEEKELSGMLSLALRQAAEDERRDAEITKEMGAMKLAREIAQPFPIVQVPAWLLELEETAVASDPYMLRCQCGLVHDVINRITGDIVLCPCGAQLRVEHKAKVVGEGGQK